MSASTDRILVLGALLLFVLGALFGRNPHPYFWWEAIPGYGALLGALGSALIIVLAKRVLAPLLRREGGE